MPAEVTQRWSTRPLTRTPDGYEAELIWDVTGVATQLEALAAPGIPTINTSHPSSASLLCENVTADTPQGPAIWEVRARYSTPRTGSFSDNPTPTPLLQRVRWRFGNVIERIVKDVNGLPILNSANTAFASPLTRPYSALLLTVYQFEPFFNIQKALTYRNKVNGDIFTVVGAGQVAVGQCMCLDIAPTGDIPISPAPASVEIAYEFEFRDGTEPFQPREVDQGPIGYYHNGTAVVSGTFTDQLGNTLASDVLLNGNGLPIESTAVFVAGHTPVAAPAQLGGRIIDPDQSSLLMFRVFNSVTMGSVFS